MFKINGGAIKYHCIIAFAFGYNDPQKEYIKPGPGISNQKIAEKIYCTAYGMGGYTRMPIICQVEIVECLDFYSMSGNIVLNIKEHSVPGKYLDTYEFARQAAEFMKKQDWNKAIVVAHPDHVWRCAKCLEKLGVETAVFGSLKTIPFNPFSAQWWTRSRFFWWLREIPAITIYWFKSWI